MKANTCYTMYVSKLKLCLSNPYAILDLINAPAPIIKHKQSFNSLHVGVFMLLLSSVDFIS